MDGACPAEAKLVPAPGGGLEPDGPGWFVLNARDAPWFGSAQFGCACVFEARGGGEAAFAEFGFNLRVLEPGQACARYHGETGQEGFLVLSGQALLLVEGEERPLGPWDFFHCPSMTEHVLLGAGEGPCLVAALGTRPAGEVLRYPAHPLAARHGAAAAADTDSPAVAYAGCERPGPMPVPLAVLDTAFSAGTAGGPVHRAPSPAGGPRPEARLVPSEQGGLEPVTPGWFVVNAAATRWQRLDEYGDWCTFEGRGDLHFPSLGINLHAVEPGQPNGRYHGETAQEGFLVLSGEPILVIEGQERRLRPWDFVHCPSRTEHIFVGAGDGPSLLLMSGARPEEGSILYPVNATAARLGASVAAQTDDPGVAYADRAPRYDIAPRADLLPGARP